MVPCQSRRDGPEARGRQRSGGAHCRSQLPCDARTRPTASSLFSRRNPPAPVNAFSNLSPTQISSGKILQRFGNQKNRFRQLAEKYCVRFVTTKNRLPTHLGSSRSRPPPPSCSPSRRFSSVSARLRVMRTRRMTRANALALTCRQRWVAHTGSRTTSPSTVTSVLPGTTSRDCTETLKIVSRN